MHIHTLLAWTMHQCMFKTSSCLLVHKLCAKSQCINCTKYFSSIVSNKIILAISTTILQKNLSSKILNQALKLNKFPDIVSLDLWNYLCWWLSVIQLFGGSIVLSTTRLSVLKIFNILKAKLMNFVVGYHPTESKQMQVSRQKFSTV